MKVVINSCYGGFGLSNEAVLMYAELKGIQFEEVEDHGYYFLYWIDREKNECFYEGDLDRSDPALVEVVETLGEDSFGSCARLKIVEVPDDVQWEIAEYDGAEWVAESHSTWG